MSQPFISTLEVLLTAAVVLSTLLTLFILTLPTPYNPQSPCQIREADFSDADKEDPKRSGFAYFQTHKNELGRLKIKTTVQVVVLGDIGRSPRMQYHALSLAEHGARVSLIGYIESEPHPDVLASRFIDITPIPPFPKSLRTDSKLLFLLIAPIKAIFQTWTLYATLAYRATVSRYMLVQNPPSIPVLAVALFVCFFRKTRLVIDWHNFGFSILALRLGSNHFLVRISEWYERTFSRAAYAHFAVTQAMASVLKTGFGVSALVLHDRPAKHFQPLGTDSRHTFLQRCSATEEFAAALCEGSRKLLVSPTSWTADENFDILLKALVGYSEAADRRSSLPRLLAIITGKGPQKDHYLRRIQQLEREGKLQQAIIRTAWLSAADYAALLASADLGISLHTSSSGVDLPMKIVDMYGAGLPVAGWSKFEAWPELVHEGVNGHGFGSAGELQLILEGLLGDESGEKLQGLRNGALKEGERRWDDEWMPIAGKLFELNP